MTAYYENKDTALKNCFRNLFEVCLLNLSPKYLTLYSLAILIVARIGSEQLCSFSRGIFQPICKHFVCVQLFLKL